MIDLDQMSNDELNELSDGELITMLSRQGLAIGMVSVDLAQRLNRIAEKLFGHDAEASLRDHTSPVPNNSIKA